MNIHRSLPLLVSCALAAAGCNSLSDVEQAQLESYKQRSKEYYGKGYFDRAEDQCRRGMLLEPEDQSLMQVLGMSLLQQVDPRDSYDRRLQEAAHRFEQAIEYEDEFDFRNRTGLGEVLTRIITIRLAMIEDTSASKTLSEGDKSVRLEKLRSDLDKRAQRAEEVLRDVLDQPRSKDNDLALSTLARLKSQTREYDAADELLTRLAAVLERSIHLRGKQLEIQNWPAEVRIAVGMDIDRLKATRVDALKLRTNVLSKLGRDADVVATYGEIELANGMQPADYFNRASSNARMGEFDAAIGDYDKFITMAAATGSGLTDTIREAMDRKAELVLQKRAADKGGRP